MRKSKRSILLSFPHSIHHAPFVYESDPSSSSYVTGPGASRTRSWHWGCWNLLLQNNKFGNHTNLALEREVRDSLRFLRHDGTKDADGVVGRELDALVVQGTIHRTVQVELLLIGSVRKSQLLNQLSGLVDVLLELGGTDDRQKHGILSNQRRSDKNCSKNSCRELSYGNCRRSSSRDTRTESWPDPRSLDSCRQVSLQADWQLVSWTLCLYGDSE